MTGAPDIIVTVTFNPEGVSVKRILKALAEAGEPMTDMELEAGLYRSGIEVDAAPFAYANKHSNPPAVDFASTAQHYSLLEAMAVNGLVVKTKRGRWTLPAGGDRRPA